MTILRTKVLLDWWLDAPHNIYWGTDRDSGLKTRTAFVKDILVVENDLTIVTDLMNCRYALYEKNKRTLKIKKKGVSL